MLLWLADRATQRARRTGKLRHLKRAWFWRSLSQWLRGGDWSPFPFDADRERRMQRPFVETITEGPGF